VRNISRFFTLAGAAEATLLLENRQRTGILRLTIHDLDRRMSWLDLYLVALFLALVGLLVAKFRG
jgi:hypothetical protein